MNDHELVDDIGFSIRYRLLLGIKVVISSSRVVQGENSIVQMSDDKLIDGRWCRVQSTECKV